MRINFVACSVALMALALNLYGLHAVEITQTVCEGNSMVLSCPENTVLTINGAFFGRDENVEVCQSNSINNRNCEDQQAYGSIVQFCDGKLECTIDVVNDKNPLKSACPGNPKYLNVTYECVGETASCEEVVCGENALCSAGVCYCPAGMSGDPEVKCTDALVCGCWGDPHCWTFDDARFTFMGRCTYDYVSTECRNSTLPSTLEPISIIQKQLERPQDNLPVSWVEWVEIRVAGVVIRFNKISSNSFTFELNGIETPLPYSDTVKGFEVFQNGLGVVFAYKNGLTVQWNGVDRAEFFIPADYAGYLCGLCGNGDGLKNNDFVDRNGDSVPQNWENYFFSSQRWGSAWRTEIVIDTDVDVDGSMCNGPPGNSTIAPPPCERLAEYEQWCAILNDASGPFADCLAILDQTVVQEEIQACTVELCGLGAGSIVERCGALENFAAVCLAEAANEGVTLSLEWRGPTTCPLSCPEDRVPDIRSGCPRTCLHPDGDYDCGVNEPVESCYCPEGLVEDAQGNCVPPSQCGCILILPTTGVSDRKKRTVDAATLALAMGEVFDGPDCTRYTCPCDGCEVDVSPTPGCTPSVPTTPTAPTCSEDACYIYGDPHYITISGFKFGINDDCSYLIASDKCGAGPASYAIYGEQDFRSGFSYSFLNAVIIEIGGNTFKVDTDLYKNGQYLSLPYNSPDGLLEVTRDGQYIVVKSPFFELAFDGTYFRFNQCTETLCGLCSINADTFATIPSFLYNNPNKPTCTSSNPDWENKRR